MKHQSFCYRNIGGRKYFNYSDLAVTDEAKKRIIAEAKENFWWVRLIKHSDGYQQLYVSGSKLKPKEYYAQD